MKKFLPLLLAAALVFALFAGCGRGMEASGSDQADTTKSPAQTALSEAKDIVLSNPSGDTWTILVYLCGTDLETDGGFASVNIQEMALAAASDKVNVIIETGGTQQWAIGGIDPGQIQRWKVVPENIELLESQPLANMGEAKALGSFLKWGVEAYPADKCMCLIWDHGGGSVAGIAVDELHGADMLNLKELSQGLSMAGVQFELVGFDACLMSTMETAAALTPYARYMVASQELEPGTGWDYTAWLNALAADTTADGLAVGTTICDSFYTKCAAGGTESLATLAVTDLSKIPDLTSAFDAMAAEMKGFTSVTEKLQPLTQAIVRAENYGGNNDSEGYTNMVDLGDLTLCAEGVLSDSGDALLEALFEAVPYRVTGNRTQQVKGNKTDNYEYNYLNQLERIKNGNTLAVSYEYDDLGNQTKENQFTSTNSQTPVRATTYSYDLLNQMTGATITDTRPGVNPPSLANNTYNPEGIRTSRVESNGVETRFYYMGSALLFTTNGAYMLETENILDPTGQIIASKRFDGAPTGQPDEYFFYHYDIRGSVTNIVDKTGSRIKNYDYDEYGNLNSSSGNFKNDVTYTGSVNDSVTGLQYMNARYYNPSTGRFLTQDTYSGNAHEPWTQHLYSYCGNNPTNMVDPSGHFPWWVLLLLLLGGCSDSSNKPDPSPSPSPKPSSTPSPSPSPSPTPVPTTKPDVPATPKPSSTPSTPKEKYGLDNDEIEALCTIAGEVNLFEDSSDAYKVLAWSMRNRKGINPSYYRNTWYDIVNKERQYKGHGNEPFREMKSYLEGNLTGYYTKKGIPDKFSSIVDTALPILRGETNDDPTRGATSANRGSKGHPGLEWRGPLGNWYFGNDPNLDGKKGDKWGW